MKNTFCLPVILLSLTFVYCSPARNPATATDDGRLDFTIVQINDVYEIAPLNGGKEGGVARVATLKKMYREKNPNTFLVLAGDFLSPSVYNSMQYMGKSIRGKQMVESLNVAGLDLAIFGNHEFDIKENELQDRIDESSFKWVSSNTFHKVNNNYIPFVKNQTQPFPASYIWNMRDNDGTAIKIGIIAITLPFNKASYVSYTDPLLTAKAVYNILKDSTDAVIAITHQSMEDDIKLATEIPGLLAIVGGHEHDGRFQKVGNVYITKALANARSAYVLDIRINKKQPKNTVKPVMVLLDEKIALDSATSEIVNKWSEVARDNYKSLGFQAMRVVMQKGAALDGREVSVRSQATNLTDLIVSAMMEAAPEAAVALLNGGSIRVDDVIQLPLTEYDILRTLPFGGGIKVADIKGNLLLKTLEAGRNNIGTGGFLQYNKEVMFDSTVNAWLLNGQRITGNNVYRVAMSDFLFTGQEANLDFLNPKNPDVVKVFDTPKNSASLKDIRHAVIEYLNNHKSTFLNN